MDNENKKILQLTLEELRKQVMKDEDIKGLFNKHFPELDFEFALDKTLADLFEYAVEKNYDALTLSLEGVKIFFNSILEELEEEDEEVEKEESYGKA